MSVCILGMTRGRFVVDRFTFKMSDVFHSNTIPSLSKQAVNVKSGVEIQTRLQYAGKQSASVEPSHE